MPNMPHARFRNTADAFADCTQTIAAMADGQEAPLWEKEAEAFGRLLGSMIDMLTHIASHTGIAPRDLIEEIEKDPQDFAQSFNALIAALPTPADDEE